MKKRATLWMCALAATATLTMPAAFAGQAPDPVADAIETRQGLYHVVRSYFGPMFAMARGRVEFNADVVAHNAARVAELAGMIPDMFRLDTSASELETEALDVIWKEKEDFNAKAKALADAATALSAAAGQGREAFATAFRSTGEACGNCHDKFREEDE